LTGDYISVKKEIMEKGLAKIAAVAPADKLAIIWGKMKLSWR